MRMLNAALRLTLRHSSFTLIAVFLSLGLLAWYRTLAIRVRIGGDNVYHLNPFLYEHIVETYDFRTTFEEQQCFDGSTGNRAEAEPIPSVVHFIWGLKHGKGSHSHFGLIEYLSIKSALMVLRPTQVKLHYASLDQSSEWFLKLKDNVTLVYHDPDRGVLGKTWGWQAAHRADLLRLQILSEEGGIYMDLDVFAIQSLDTILSCQKDIIMGHEGGNRAGLANAVIVSRRGSTFVDRWIGTYDNFSTQEWNYHSVTLPKSLALSYPEEICTLSPVAFFWPTWSYKHLKYMHRSLSPAEVSGTKEDLLANSGALFKNQLAYHAWSQLAWDPYLKDLTPELIRMHDTRFNMMVRHFLD
ncbi:hypothetical protein MMC26_001433 [Xylographa opegraphella]|nr:hypothetical protein [Xylographa opegraphella]